MTRILRKYCIFTYFAMSKLLSSVALVAIFSSIFAPLTLSAATA